MMLLQLWYTVCWIGREVGDVIIDDYNDDLDPPLPINHTVIQTVYETVYKNHTVYVDRIVEVEVLPPPKQWFEFSIEYDLQTAFTFIGIGTSMIFSMFILFKSLVLVYTLLYKVRVWYTNKKTILYNQTPFMTYESEKMVVGSEFVYSEPPKIQCEVWASYNINGLYTEFKPVAQAWRYGSYIITAYHAVSDAHGLKLQANQTMVEIDVKRFKSMAGDIAYVLLSPMELGQLRLASAKFPKTTNQKVLVSVSAFGKKSQGFVKPYDAFGYLQYDGSTIKGFSGAPYMLTSTMVLGMHVGGHQLNVGYDAAYIAALFDRINESSTDRDDFLQDDIIEMHQSPFNSEEYQVKITSADGTIRYKMMDDEDIEKSGIRKRMRRTKIKDLSYHDESLNYVFEDQAPKAHDTTFTGNLDQGNYLRPAANASAAGHMGGNAEYVQPQNKPTSSGTQSSQAPISRTNMVHPTSTHAQPNNHLEDMLRVLKLAQQCRMSRKSREQFVRLFLDLSNGDMEPETRRSRSGSIPNSRKGLVN